MPNIRTGTFSTRFKLRAMPARKPRFKTALLCLLCLSASGCLSSRIAGQPVQPWAYFDLAERADCAPSGPPDVKVDIDDAVSNKVNKPTSPDSENFICTSPKIRPAEGQTKTATTGPATGEKQPGKRRPPQRVFIEEQASGYLIQSIEAFQESAAWSLAAPFDSIRARRFMEHGMTVTNRLCAQFMSDMTQKRQERHFGRDFFNNTNTAVSAVLNLTKSSNLVTGATSAVFGMIDSSLQSWDRHYVASVDLAAAEALMRSAMVKQAEDNLMLTSLTHSQAENRLINYANSCSFNGIKRLVNQSVVDASINRIRVSNGAAVIAGADDGTSLSTTALNRAYRALARCEWSEAKKAFDEADESNAIKYGTYFQYGSAAGGSNPHTEIASLNLSKKGTSEELPEPVIQRMKECAPK